MAAPSSAYVLADGQFLKVMTRKGSTLYPCYVARFLSGTSAQGGYATTSSTMRERIKSLFHLDEIADVREEQADGTMKSVGFVGLVNPSGSNAKYHNLTTRGAGLAHREGAALLEHMNDAGLNTLPVAAVDFIRSRFANIIVADVSVSSAFYLMTSAVQWVLRKGSTPIMMYSLGEVAQRNSKSFRVSYYDASSNPTAQVASGESLPMDVKGTNGEGTTTYTTTIATLPRVLWEASQGRPEWRYSASEPSYMADIRAASVVRVDLYEADVDKFNNLSNIVSSVPINPPKLYAGTSDDYPTMSSAPSAGWYYCADLAQYTGEDAWAARAVYVDSTGTAKYWKALSDPRTQLFIGMSLVDAATESDRPSNTYRTLELYAEVRGGWYEQYPTIRVRVGVSGGSGAVAAMDATLITDRQGSEVPHSTNLTGLNINTQLTQADGSFVKSWTQVYRSQAIMTQYGGSRYYDAGNGVYYQLDHSNDLWWSVVCLDSSGNEHDFEGDITWEGGAIGASTAPVG